MSGYTFKADGKLNIQAFLKQMLGASGEKHRTDTEVVCIRKVEPDRLPKFVRVPDYTEVRK